MFGLQKRVLIKVLIISGILSILGLGLLAISPLSNLAVWNTSNIWRYTPLPLHHPNPNFKAAFITFTKGDTESLTNLQFTIRELQDKFNHNHHYPYIIFTNEPLSNKFKEAVATLTKNNAVFEILDKRTYGEYPSFIDKEKVQHARKEMSEKNIIYGDSEDYRFQARFFSGLIFSHPALEDIDYYWRFEIGTEYPCDIKFDPFQYMKDHNKKLSFSISLYEYAETIPTLYTTFKDYANNHPADIYHANEPDSLWSFITDSSTGGYNNCHFWTNFQIADLNFFKSQQYMDYFNHIDQSGGIFYERWGDPVIHTLGATLFLTKNDIQFWDDICYRVANTFTHCPADKSIWASGTCRPEQNFDDQSYSCLRYFKNN
ncbi:unnamed protein product [Cunninghamella blakesleeana]